MKRKRYLPWGLLALAVCLVVAVMYGAARVFYLVRTRADRFIYLTWKDKEPVSHYDAYFTWRSFSGYPENAEAVQATIYIWNGEDVGQGCEGFEEIVKRVGMLPAGAYVKIFPNYYALWYRGDPRGDPEFPFWDCKAYGKLREIAVSRAITLVYSTRDQQGEVLPMFKKFMDPVVSTNSSGSTRGKDEGEGRGKADD